LTTVYFDTSAFVKLLVAEAGSGDAGAIWDAADVVASSRLLYPETAAALASARRSGRMTEQQHFRVKTTVEAMWAQMHVVEVTAAVAGAAASFAERYALRGYDAVHLASAVAFHADAFVASDAALAAAGLQAGMHVAQPGI